MHTLNAVELVSALYGALSVTLGSLQRCLLSLPLQLC
jgi:hypothetical protein